MKDLTVVIQGPDIKENCCTLNLVRRLRNYFPCSKIVFSTWSYVDYSLHNVHTLVNLDPGQDTLSRLRINSPRLICSSINAINLVETKYTLKLRSDSAVSSQLVDAIYVYAEKGITRIIDFVISHPTKPFMIDDRSMLGKTEDLRKLWSLNYCQATNKSYALIQKIRNYNVIKKCFYSSNLDFAIEQLLFLEYTKSWHLLYSKSFSRLYSIYLRKLRETFFLVNAYDSGISYLKWPHRNLLVLPYLFNSAPINVTSTLHASYRAFKGT